MHPTLNILHEVGQYDDSLRHIGAERRRIAGRLETAQGKEVQAKAAVDDVDQKLRAAQDRERTLARDIAQYTRSRKSALNVLEGGGGDPEAAQRQLSRCDGMIDEAETETLELMEQRDGLEVDRDAALTILAARTRDREAEQARGEARCVELDVEESRLSERRTTAILGLDKDAHRRYHDLMRRKGTAVAKIEKETCTACNTKMPGQQIADIRRGLIAPCRQCARWLVLDDK
jgi:uncharacterized protein